MGKKSSQEESGNLDESQITEGEAGEISYEDKLKYVNIIAQPMASKKLASRVYKLIKKASKHKDYIRHGLKDIQRVVRKGERGIMVFAGDISPIEIMCHLPAVCEEKDIPYIYTPSRQDLGAAMGVRRGVVVILVKEHEEYQDVYDKVKEEINKIPKVF